MYRDRKGFFFLCVWGVQIIFAGMNLFIVKARLLASPLIQSGALLDILPPICR